MSPASVAKFYEVEYRPIYRGKQKATQSFFEDQIRHGRQILNRMRRWRKKTSDQRVFDIGCGAGGVLVPFKEVGFQCFGCDFGSDYLERGRQAGLTLETGDYHSLEKYAPANVIVASHVLEHCLDPIEELKGWASLLSDDGLLYIEVPGLFDVYRNYKSLAGFFHVAHTFNFTLGTLRSVAHSAGLEFIAGDESVWALFRIGKGASLEPKASDQAAEIERFLRKDENGIIRLPREARRHALRLARSASKRLTKP